MENLSINEMLSKHSKNVNTKISAGYSLSGKELLTVTEAKAAIKEIVEAALRKGVAMGLSLSTMTDEPFTSQGFQALEEGLIKNVIETQINYGI